MIRYWLLANSYQLNGCRSLLTVSGFGSTILRISDFAPAENQAGNEYSALSICMKKKRDGYIKLTLQQPTIKDMEFKFITKNKVTFKNIQLSYPQKQECKIVYNACDLGTRRLPDIYDRLRYNI